MDFDEFYAAHYADLIVQIYVYFGDRQKTQDLVQEAFCRAYARWGRLRDHDDPVAWVRRVAWNLARSRGRRGLTIRRFLCRDHAEALVAGPGPDRVALMVALAGLPDRQRRAVVMHYLADMSVTEIADHEDVSEGTVKSWLHRGRAALGAQPLPEVPRD